MSEVPLYSDSASVHGGRVDSTDSVFGIVLPFVEKKQLVQSENMNTRENERVSKTQREKERERESESERAALRARAKEKKRDKGGGRRKREREREREKERGRERERERGGEEAEGQRERKRHRDLYWNQIKIFICIMCNKRIQATVFDAARTVSTSCKNQGLASEKIFFVVCRGTSLIRKRLSLGPYRGPMPRVLGGS